jgi:DNA-binding transcriptional regulator GbsR (MarR family)
MNDIATLDPVRQRFILHWGEMGAKWGINRTVAQIHALLYISQKPLNAEEISDTLAVARSNVSTSLKELQSWRIIRLVHVIDDKRDHFESMKDVWEMFRIVLDERKRREIDPTIQLLRECLEETKGQRTRDDYTETRLRELLTFFETTGGWYQQVRDWPTATLVKFLKFGDKILKALGLG